MRRVILFLATGAGAGYIPGAPGTAGTLVAIPLSLLLNRVAAHSLPLALLTLAAVIAVAFWSADRAEAIFGEKDAPRIVIDEIAGFMLANFAAPQSVSAIIAAFILFRFFDIIKPYPARRAERMPGGIGVVMDDLVAGVYSLLLVRLAMAWGLL
ncbi:MAG TPA: phosphatidylglycerophosphatase A [Candidatus Binatia bacterium]|nr:phosphatidylglycerophosphatase A [Candidatus Binatia bacterium]